MIPVAMAGSALLLALASTPGVSRDEEAGPVGPCATGQICQFDDPEDLADLTGTEWIILSQEARDGASGVAAWHSVSGALIAYRDADIGPACLPGARSGGLGVRRDGAGYRLVHILHPTNGGADGVEILRIVMKRGVPHLRRTACVAAPPLYFLNDVAPDGMGGFVATHMFDRSRPRSELDADFRAGRPTGFIVRWTAQAGWRKVAGSDGAFPNGIDLSANARWIAFAETYGHVLNRIRMDGSARQRVPLAMQPDNVTAAGGDRFIVAGGIGRPMVSTRNCAALRRPGCGFPSRALSVDFGRGGRQTVIVTSGGESVPGMSVALRKGGILYLGTAFGDRITTVVPADDPVRLP